LKRLIESLELRQEMGFRGRQCVAEYSWDATVKNLVEIWNNAISVFIE
jgi:glycosyltransferase involved in cell wall biosynthesis